MQNKILDIVYRDLSEEDKVIVKLKGTVIVEATALEKIGYGLNKNAHRSERSDWDNDRTRKKT
jgi:hypothetical protein